MAAIYRQKGLKLLLLLTFLVPGRHKLYPPWRGNTDTLDDLYRNCWRLRRLFSCDGLYIHDRPYFIKVPRTKTVRIDSDIHR